MGKKRRNVVVVRNDEGEPVQIDVPDVINLREPQKDDRTGVVPEFVNVSNKVQIIPIPDDPGEPFTVPMMGVLRGAQWRMLAEQQPAWGRTAPFVERVLRDDKTFDPVYLLTEEQMIGLVGRLGKQKRIQVMTENSKIVESDQVTRLGYRDVHMGPIAYRNSDSVDARPRSADDRKNIMSAVMQRVFAIQKAEEARKKEQGVLEATQ